MARRVLTDLAVPLVTSLPLAPVDGEVVDYLADAANGIVWRFRYRAASASIYKWELVGGPPLRAINDATFTPNTTSYADYSTPTIPLPLAGDYDFAWGCPYHVANASSGTTHGLVVGGAAPAVQVDELVVTAGTMVPAITTASRRRKTGIAAGTVVKIQSKISASAANNVGRWLEALPVRVG